MFCIDKFYKISYNLNILNNKNDMEEDHERRLIKVGRTASGESQMGCNSTVSD